MVLVTHGNLANEFVGALQHVIGDQKQIATVCIGPDDEMEKRRIEITQKIKEVDQGRGVILLTDMFGGTPSNLAISVMNKKNVEVITGINLPMLIKLASVRKSGNLIDTVNIAQEAGRKYINIATQLISQE